MIRNGVRRILAPFALGILLAACGGDRAPQATTEGDRPDIPARAPIADVARELRAAVRNAPDDPAARRLLAIALHDVGRHFEAVDQFERLVALSPTRRHLLDLALACGDAGRDQRAVETYERILQLAPDDPVALHNLGNVARRRGNDEVAIGFYTRALESDPDYLMAHYHLGQSLERAEHPRRAYRAYENAVQIEPTDGDDVLAADDALYRLALLDLKMGAVERAASFLAQVIEANPGHPQAHRDYGEALMQLGKREEALAQLDVHMRNQNQREAN